tara:strand:- start:1382 stop:1612 length:231 start_codon:yes stop_codon:yes gene_type:complete
MTTDIHPEAARQLKVLLSKKEAADALGIRASLLDKLIKDGELQTLRVGARRVLIHIDEIARFVENKINEQQETSEK